MKAMNPRKKRLLKMLPILVLGGLLGAATGGWAGRAEKVEAPELRLNVQDSSVTRDGRIATSFAPVVKQVAPSVVRVFTVQKARQPAVVELPPGMDNPMFRRFFGDDFFMPGPGRPMPSQRGIGSGVIVTSDGYILTNNHVVDGADEVKVALQDGREFTAKVVGKDAKTDVAVIKVAANELPALPIADSDRIEVGDVVLAVGNPFGIGQTVTMGMVSATGRATLGLDYEDFIQTDAAINPGNSGGALVDAEGRLIGINTAILSRTGGNQGIGFAIPVNLAREVMTALVTDGKVTRGYLGVLIQDVTPALAREFKLGDRKGALVGEVTPRSPADRAGLESGDVVLEINGKDVRDSRHLKLEVAKVKPGETATLKILRGGDPETLKVKVGELPGEKTLASTGSSAAQDQGTLNGVTVADLDARMRRQFDIPGSIQGALVTAVDPGSAAEEAGLRPGDVILEINRERVKSANEAVKLTENPEDKTTLLRVWSRGKASYLVVDESDRPVS